MNKKVKQPTSKYRVASKTSKVEEPLVFYSTSKNINSVKDFTYKDFKKIADKVSFTQKEWAEMLHISERTLQRYAKDNTVFSFSVMDRILQISRVIKKGEEVFGSADKFMLWLKDNPYMLEGKLSVQSLASFDGIQKILTQLGRIEHGIFA